MDARERFTRLHARLDRWLVGVFLVLLGAPLVDEFLRVSESRGPEDYELRNPAPKPRLKWNLVEINAFPAAFEEWHKDQFGLRDLLLGANSIERLFVFGISPTPIVELGKDRWMFYTGDWSAEVFQGLRPLEPGALTEWQSMLENHRDVSTALGAKHVFVFGPNKETVYPDYVPPSWKKSGPSRLEQLDRWLKQTPDAPGFLDMRPAFAAARAHDEPFDHLYYELGTHWNGRGTYLAYSEVLRAMARMGVPVEPLPWDSLIRMPNCGQGDTWARAMYIAPLVEQRNFWIAPTSMGRLVKDEKLNGIRDALYIGPDPHAPKCVMFHDSFGQSVEQMLSAHFSRFRCIWSPIADQKVLEEEMPDVVLELYVERALVGMVPSGNMLGAGNLVKLMWERSTKPLYTLEPAGYGALDVRGQAKVTPATDGRPGFVFDTPDHSASLVFPKFPLPAKGDLLLHVEIEAGVEGELLVLPVLKGENEARRKRVLRVALPVGPSDFYLRMARTEKLERLMLHAVPGKCRYILRTFEVRAMPGN